MNKTNQLTLISALLFSTFTSSAFAVSNDELLAQIKALTQRIDVLEERLQMVEEEPEQTLVTAPAKSSGPWQQISIGMRHYEVEELLGQPSNKQKGSVELWFYSDKRKDGPFVKFVFKQVHSWRGPVTEK